MTNHVKMRAASHMFGLKIIYMWINLVNIVPHLCHSQAILRNNNSCSRCFSSFQPPERGDIGLGSSNFDSLDVNSNRNHLDGLNNSFLSISDASDHQGKNIYSSLMKILQLTRHQMERDDEKPEDRMDHSNPIAAETIDVPISITRLDGGISSPKNLDLFGSSAYTNERRVHRDQRLSSTSKQPSDAMSLDVFSEPIEQVISTGTDDNSLGSNGGSKKKVYSKFIGSNNENIMMNPKEEKKAPVREQQSWTNYPSKSPIKTSSKSPWSSNDKLNQDNPINKPLFSISSSSDQSFHPQIHSEFASDASADTKDDLGAARFSAMINNLKQEFQMEIDDGQPDEQPVVALRRPFKPRGPLQYAESKKHRASHSIPIGRYAPGHKPKNSPIYLGSTETYIGSMRDLISEQTDHDGASGSKLSAVVGESTDDNQRPKPYTDGVYLQQIDTKPISTHYSYQSSVPIHHQYQPIRQPTKIYYALSNVPNNGYRTGTASTTQMGSAFNTMAVQSPHDLANQPQTIQITAIPSGGISNSPAVVRVNSVNGIAGNPMMPGGWMDPLGRQVYMVNSERRTDWSWIVWPVAVVIALPLVLSAIFIPVFLKSIIIFIQILQSFGLIMPVTNALSQQFGPPSNNSNITHHLTS